MTKMEELIHHFIIHTEGLNAPEGEIYFGAENPKGELGFYINSKGGGTPHRLADSRAVVSQPEHPACDPAGPHDERRGGTAILGSLDFVMEKRSMNHTLPLIFLLVIVIERDHTAFDYD